ncbi:beta-phosphoglucomutase [Oenococcus kitaharae]|uniref:Beta-phosphoglucomutase n=1 Tax=Oenococcus kitaharae DSM 17330 TaxID=1045004 RepID=G9WHZ8_9LACO|nr:beta-phosphoglucomutase [Oenococcus kitaharae]EHN58883.1 Beta-phosphoglucomutase [Oenococcus kitaharae DSM 17330]MCV3296865.1 beta-phosphoglucomutase [Oenococcus kitaharae]OEY81792.1 beta-phosphoglucomutase [Oenococcus kitaharae]OEY84023.1 beta-phosphoglucomutase [Oenococcus kitaharae]OEY85621.1 beta-phosphoglucomutase [Oenococcus kitaharae]
MAVFSDIKGMTFDLDGVITDTASFHEKAWHQTANEVGTVWTQALADQLKGLSRMDSLALILKAGHHEDDYTQAEKVSLAEKKNRYYQQLITKLTADDLLPGIGAFLNELRSAGYRMSIASASKNAVTILKQLQITDYFQGIVDPASLSAGKPDPEIFIKAGELLALPPMALIGLEDAAAGVQSIKAAGQTALGIGLAAKKAEPDLYFDRTQDITLAAIHDKMN